MLENARFTENQNPVLDGGSDAPEGGASYRPSRAENQGKGADAGGHRIQPFHRVQTLLPAARAEDFGALRAAGPLWPAVSTATHVDPVNSLPLTFFGRVCYQPLIAA